MLARRGDLFVWSHRHGLSLGSERFNCRILDAISVLIGGKDHCGKESLLPGSVLTHRLTVYLREMILFPAIS